MWWARLRRSVTSLVSALIAVALVFGTVNYALATFEALRKTAELKVRGEQTDRLKIKEGAVSVYVHKVAPTAPIVDEAPPLPEDSAVEGEDLTETETGQGDTTEEAKEV